MSVTDTYNFPIGEGERQMVLMALAHLAVERPGWDYALTEIAKKMDTLENWKRRQHEALRGQREEYIPRGQPVLFTVFKRYHTDAIRHAEVEELAKDAASKHLISDQTSFTDGFKAGWAACVQKHSSQEDEQASDKTANAGSPV